MFATVMMPPVFGVGSTSPERLPAMPAFQSSPFRPSRPSPLSSSPVRASSPSASPPHAFSSLSSSQMDTQSSPIQPHRQQQQQQQSPFSFSSECTPPTKPPQFRFASRPTKPVPRGLQNRDAAQQTRRSLFLRNVRQRADDRTWDRRNFEQELQKLEWWSLERDIRQARETNAMSMLTEQDIEDAADWAEVSSSSMPSFWHSDVAGEGRRVGDSGVSGTSGTSKYYDDAADDDDEKTLDERMADLLAMEEEAELEALIASLGDENAQDADHAEQQLPQQQPEQPFLRQQNEEAAQYSRPSSVVYSDDGDYDAIFAEILTAAEGGEDTVMGSQ